MTKKGIYIFSLLVLMVFMLDACSAYQQVLKSKDPDFKYQKAIEYFEGEQYVRSQTLLDDISTYYKGTERAQEVLIYLARSYMGQKSYNSAANYYETYIRNYPKGRYSIEAQYQIGHCYYLDAPDARLDQDITRRSIAAFARFIELYPESQYVDQAYNEMNEMYDKLAYKELLSAKLYYNLGTYLGNNYLSAEIVARNAQKDYPSNSHQEELSWLIMQAKYQQMVNSFENKKQDRAREAEDEYYSFKTEYPDSKHIKEADRMYKEIKKIVK